MERESTKGRLLDYLASNLPVEVGRKMRVDGNYIGPVDTDVDGERVGELEREFYTLNNLSPEGSLSLAVTHHDFGRGELEKAVVVKDYSK